MADNKFNDAGILKYGPMGYMNSPVRVQFGGFAGLCYTPYNFSDAKLGWTQEYVKGSVVGVPYENWDTFKESFNLTNFVMGDISPFRYGIDSIYTFSYIPYTTQRTEIATFQEGVSGSFRYPSIKKGL